jgi:ABC-type multidrug transport system ATPase subunit/pSer/pThr/pTyr-binding forkhead associated (FHA) protein
MPKFCRFCGKKLQNPQARFCPACGRELTPSVPPQANGPEQPRLLIRIPGQSLQETPLDRTAFTIGRKPDNDIVLSLDYVSGHHGRLEQRGMLWHYVDLGSTNGTLVNGRRVQSAVLRDGDILRVGDTQGNSVGLTFRAVGALGAAAPVPATIHMGATVLGAKPSLVIGRNPQSDIPLPAPLVSWQHARLDRTARGHLLTDLHSTNGTFVNGQRLSRPQLLQPGDVVQIGPFKLVYETSGFQQYAATGGVRLDGVRLTREVGRGARQKRILKNVSISIQPREFVALVGTSGAGKSTLLMALNGFTRAEGQVLVNGDDLYQHFDLYRTMIGYVPQDDIVHKELTVASALRYAAQLRLPPDTSSQEIERRIDQVLQQVGLTGQKDQVINSLSGGQRKRVSIAAELLAEPRLFFLDEPTSGLDPGLEKKMMYMLRHLADEGRTVVLVTHTTANIAQCDHVGFLSQGRLVYFGPPAEARQFFGVTGGDFADIYTQLEDTDPKQARQKAARWEQRFQQSPQYRQYVADRQKTLPQAKQKASQTMAQQRPRVNLARQFLILTRRYLDLVLHDKLLLTVLLVIMPVIGLLLLLIAGHNWLVGDTEAVIARQLAEKLASGEQSATYAIVGKSQTLLFMLSLAAVLLGLFSAAYEIVKERSIYQRERMVTLRLLPYLASKVTVLGTFAILQCLLLLFVISWKVKLPGAGVFLPAPLEMYVTLVLGALAAITMGLFVSALVPNTNTVIYIILLALFFQIIFAGVIFELPPATKNLSYLTLSRWTVEGLGVSADIDGLNTFTRTRFQLDPIIQEVSLEVEKPSEDWEPVTVVTETQEIVVPCPSGIDLTVPITVPQVTTHEMVTVTETITQEVTVEPEPVDVVNEQEFQVDYTHTAGHLWGDWLIMLGFGLLSGFATVMVLKRKDVG